jgi:hypothetical protein
MALLGRKIGSFCTRMDIMLPTFKYGKYVCVYYRQNWFNVYDRKNGYSAAQLLGRYWFLSPISQQEQLVAETCLHC